MKDVVAILRRYGIFSTLFNWSVYCFNITQSAKFALRSSKANLELYLWYCTLNSSKIETGIKLVLIQCSNNQKATKKYIFIWLPTFVERAKTLFKENNKTTSSLKTRIFSCLWLATLANIDFVWCLTILLFTIVTKSEIKNIPLN